MKTSEEMKIRDRIPIGFLKITPLSVGTIILFKKNLMVLHTAQIDFLDKLSEKPF